MSNTNKIKLLLVGFDIKHPESIVSVSEEFNSEFYYDYTYTMENLLFLINTKKPNIIILNFSQDIKFFNHFIKRHIKSNMWFIPIIILSKARLDKNIKNITMENLVYFFSYPVDYNKLKLKIENLNKLSKKFIS